MRHTICRTKRRTAALLFCALPILSVCSLAQAQPQPQEIVIGNPKLTSPPIRFGKAITALADSAKTTIIAEGAPIAFDETKLQSAAYTAAAPAAKVTLLAYAADYDVKNSGNVFLLTKRYSNPEDLPCVTLGECRASMKDISAMLNRLMPPPQPGVGDPIGLSVKSFFRSLSPEQVEAMKQTPLPSSQFTGEQRNKAAAMLATTYLFSVVSSTERTFAALKALPDVSLRKENGTPSASFVFDDRNRPGVTYTLQSGYAARGERTLPVPGKILFDIAPTTLGKEFAKLNERKKEDTAGTPSAVYAAGIDYEEKPLTVAGLERLDPERAASALAGVYDLRLRSLGGTRTLARRPLLANVTIFNVGDAIAAALPAPLAQLLRGEADGKFLSSEMKEALQGLSPGRAKQMTVRLLNEAAVQRLRQSHERELDVAGRRGISVAVMDATDRRAITVAMLSPFLEAAATVLNDKAPVYIEQFGQLAVSGNRYINPKDSKPKINLNLLVRSSGQGGGYRIVSGYGNVRDEESP